MQRAASDTVTLLGARKKLTPLVAALVIGLLALEFLRATQGNPAAFQQLDWFVAWGIAFGAFAIVAFLIMIFFVSPYRLDRDAETRIRRAQAELDALTMRLLPRLEIVFDPSHCWLRVGIRNPGGETIRSAEVWLDRVDAPYGDVGLQIPSAVDWMDDRRPVRGSLDLNPTGEGHHHVDLVAHRSRNMFSRSILPGAPKGRS